MWPRNVSPYGINPRETIADNGRRENPPNNPALQLCPDRRGAPRPVPSFALSMYEEWWRAHILQWVTRNPPPRRRFLSEVLWPRPWPGQAPT